MVGGTGELGIMGLNDDWDGDRSFLSKLTGSTIMLLLSESRSLSAHPSHDRFDIIIPRGSIVIELHGHISTHVLPGFFKFLLIPTYPSTNTDVFVSLSNVEGMEGVSRNWR